MRFAACVAILAVGLVTGCRSAGLAECTEDGQCPSDQVCNRHTRLCYKPDPEFAVEITAPENNAALVNTSFRLAGTISNAGQGINSVQYNVADGGWVSIQATSSGHFEAYPTLPKANGDPLTVSVRAEDQANDLRESSVSVIVDNIGPVATLTAKDGERSHPLNVAVTFTEPVLLNGSSDSGTPLVLTPPDGVGTWNSTRTEYRITALRPDTVYAAEVKPDAVRDEANNPSAETHATFRTAAVQPPSSFRLTVPTGLTFDAIDAKADTDGVVTLAVHAAGTDSGRVIWGWFDPSTGGFVSHTVSTESFSSLEVGASVGDSLEAPRLHTLTVRGISDAGTGTDVFWASSLDGTDPTVSELIHQANAIVPGPPGCGESGASDEVGLVLATDAGTPLYVRGGNKLPLSFTTDLVAYASPSDWTFASVADGGLTLERLDYWCGSGPAPFTSTVTPISVDPVDITPGTLSAVAVPGHQLYAFDVSGSGRTVACVPCDTAPCVRGSLQELRVASLHDGGTILGAWRDQYTSDVALGGADLSDGCPGASSDWSSLGTVPISPFHFQPVQFGRTPGIVYVDSDRKHVGIAFAGQ